jgi:uncharacterized cupin superfamily protein
VPESNSSSYPEPFREGQRKRFNRRLGDHAGLKNYGVNLIRVLPGGQSSARHAHSKQDEFVYVIEGEFVLEARHVYRVPGRDRGRSSFSEISRRGMPFLSSSATGRRAMR